MNLEDIYREIPEGSKKAEAAGILVVICTEGAPIIYRTMEEGNYQKLLVMLRDVKPMPTMQ